MATPGGDVNKPKPRSLDWDAWGSRRVALRVGYVGWDYHGFASQEHDDNTIEHSLFAALLKTKLIESRETCEYSRCGRTDKGVSALGQVIALRVRSRLVSGPDVIPPQRSRDNQREDGDDYDFPILLNAVLPPSIRVTAWAPVGLEFSARFSCLHRTYKYFFVRGELNLEKMQQAAQYLVGEHDFRNFCKMDTAQETPSFDRRILWTQILPAQDSGGPHQLCYFAICGTSFLWHMVRNIMAVLFLVGRDLERPAVVNTMMDVERVSRKPVFDLAPATPLVLLSCGFDDLCWREEPAVQQRLLSGFDGLWTDLVLKSAVLGELRDSVAAPALSPSHGEKRKYVPLLERDTHASLEEHQARKARRSARREARKMQDEAKTIGRTQ